MKLYQFPPSPNSQKVSALAREVGANIESVYVDLFAGAAKQPALLALNPNGLIPILVDGDFVLWESNAMLGYVAAKAGRFDLAPTEPRARAEVDRWLAWLNAHLAPAIGKVAIERVVKRLSGSGAPDEARVQEGLRESAQLLGLLDGALRGREFLAGALSIAEFAVAPEVAITPACGIDLSVYPNVSSWLTRVTARASFQETFARAKQASLELPSFTAKVAV